jgi:hypothetical protein
MAAHRHGEDATRVIRRHHSIVLSDDLMREASPSCSGVRMHILYAETAIGALKLQFNGGLLL